MSFSLVFLHYFIHPPTGSLYDGNSHQLPWIINVLNFCVIRSRGDLKLQWKLFSVLLIFINNLFRRERRFLTMTFSYHSEGSEIQFHFCLRSAETIWNSRSSTLINFGINISACCLLAVISLNNNNSRWMARSSITALNCAGSCWDNWYKRKVRLMRNFEERNKSFNSFPTRSRRVNFNSQRSIFELNWKLFSSACMNRKLFAKIFVYEETESRSNRNQIRNFIVSICFVFS